MPRADGPFEVLEKINDNAYRIDLPGEYGVSCTFNVADLKPYHGDDYFGNLRANSPQQGEDDVPKETSIENQTHDHQDHPNIREVKDTVALVKELRTASYPVSTGNYPGFVCLVGPAMEVTTKCLDHSF